MHWGWIGLTPPTSAPGPGSLLPHLGWAWAHRCRICTGIGLTPAMSALGLDWAHHSHICTGTGLTPPTSRMGLGSPLPHLHRDWAHPSHICTTPGLTELTAVADHSALQQVYTAIRDTAKALLDAERETARCGRAFLALAASTPPYACRWSVGRGRRFSLPNKREPEGAHRCHICTGIAGLTPPTPAL